MVQPPRPPDDPYERIKFFEAEKEREKDRRQKRDQKKKPLVWGKILSTLKNTVDVFQEASQKEKNTFLSDLLKTLNELKSSFERLKHADLSQESEFLHQFSKQWNRFLTIYKKAKKYPKIFKSLQFFLNCIEEYPEKGEFSLDYYFVEYAGGKWVPFPFMEMILALYNEHQKDPENCHLTDWTKILDDLITTIREKD